MIPTAILLAVGIVATVGLLASPYPELAPAPALGLLGLLVLARRPALGIHLIVFLVPFAAYRKIGEVVNVPWLIGGLLVAVVAVRFVVARRLPVRVSPQLWVPLLAFVAIATVSALAAENRSFALDNVFLALAAGVFLVLAMALLGPDDYRGGIARNLVWSVSIGSALGIASYQFGLHGFAEEHNSGHLTRAVGGSIDPNNTAIMILFVLPLAVHLAVHAASRGRRLMMSALILLNVVALTLTMSRSGMLIGAVGIAMLLYHYRRSFEPRRLGLLLGGAFIVGSVLTVAVPKTVIDRQESLLDWQDRSLQRRSSYVGVAWEAFQQRPLIGSGPGSFPGIYARSEASRAFSTDPRKQRRYAHNTYLEVLVGMGAMGVIAYGAALLGALRGFWRAEEAMAAEGDGEGANITASYRMGFLLLLAFLLMFSEIYHKYLLLSLALSQLALLSVKAPNTQPFTVGGRVRRTFSRNKCGRSAGKTA